MRGRDGGGNGGVCGKSGGGEIVERETFDHFICLTHRCTIGEAMPLYSLKSVGKNVVYCLKYHHNIKP